MPRDHDFLKIIDADPNDRSARLVYADWLEEQSDPRGEVIRVEEEVRDLKVYADRYWELKPRRSALLKASPKPWLKRMGYETMAGSS